MPAESFSLITSSRCFTNPKIIIADNEARLRLRKGHLAGSTSAIGERGMFGVHLPTRSTASIINVQYVFNGGHERGIGVGRDDPLLVQVPA